MFGKCGERKCVWYVCVLQEWEKGVNVTFDNYILGVACCCLSVEMSAIVYYGAISHSLSATNALTITQ